MIGIHHQEQFTPFAVQQHVASPSKSQFVSDVYKRLSLTSAERLFCLVSNHNPKRKKRSSTSSSRLSSTSSYNSSSEENCFLDESEFDQFESWLRKVVKRPEYGKLARAGVFGVILDEFDRIVFGVRIGLWETPPKKVA